MPLFFVLLCCLFSLSSIVAEDNLELLEKQAKQYEQRLLNVNNKKNKVETTLNPENKLQLAETAYFFYSSKDCKLAANIQKKLFSYQKKIQPYDWYRLSLYSSCAYQPKTASKAIFLAWKNEQEAQQKHRYKVMLADYLFSLYQLKNSWNKELVNLYQQLKTNVTNQSQNAQQLKELDKKLKQLEQINKQNSQLFFTHLVSKADQGKLKLCMKVNLSGYWNNEKNRAIKLADYIRIKPKVDLAFERNYNELCLSGVKWSTEYQLEILKGLAIESKLLQKNISLTHKTITRPADFWFKSSRYILSKNSSSQLPIYTVNIPQIHVALYRILPENLQNKEFLRLFKKNISNHELKRVSEQLGNKVWSSDVMLQQPADKKFDNELNKTVLKQIPLPGEYVKKSGVYILIAAKNEQQLDTQDGYEYLSAQWLIVSDIGLTSYKSSNGQITLLAHSLETGKSLANLKLSMYSQNNSLLATEVTDITGKAVFPTSVTEGKKGLQPMQLIASHNDYGFLFYPLESAGFDLSDRGVSGRMSLASIEAYLYSERGVYRPGEAVNLMALLRDDKAQAIKGLPLTLKISNPDGLVIREQLMLDQGAGAYQYAFNLPPAIRTGRWIFEVYADLKAAAIGQMSFLIEEIKPPRLQAQLTTDEKPIRRGQSKQFVLQADYLFGAPAAELKVNSYFSYQQSRTPFANYKDFVFGSVPRQQQADIFKLASTAQTTDKKGQLIIKTKWPAKLTTKQTLSGFIRTEIIDHDGTMIAVQKHFKVLNLPLYIGIGKSFTDFAEINSNFNLKIVTLDKNAKINQQQNLNWSLVREESYFQWFNKHGSWSYEKIVQDKIQQKGIMSSRQADIELLAFNLDQGQYRLEVFDPKTEISSSYRFTVGQQVSSINDLPDVVKLSLDKPAYQQNDEIELSIESPYSGEADIVIADNKIHSILKLHLTEKNTRIKIPVSKDWGVGSYALVSVYRGSKAKAEKTPQLAKRAMGVIWINRDKSQYKLDVKIKTPEKVKPMQVVEVPIAITGYKTGAPVYLTLAAVDQGVLNLTQFKAPQPVQYFLAKRQLETQINDNYARLINNINGKAARLRVGGGSMQDSSRASMPAKNIKIVSLFSGIVNLDNSGKANVTLAIPDFNGQLKLMAVVWDKSKLGSAQKTLYVNDDVVVQASLPRFMSSGDNAKISFLIHNLHADAGEYSLKLISDDLLARQNSEIHFTLAKGESLTQSFMVSAKQVGNAKLRIILTGPEQYQLEKHYNIGIRGVGLATSEQKLQQLPGNSEWQINQQDMLAYEPQSVVKTLSLSSGLNLGVYSLLDKLDRYPHGCLEQLVSRAMPLLSINILSERWNYPVDPMLDSRINEAITLIIEKQRYDGSFALWRVSDKQESWLSMYAMEFLLEARNKSYRVPDFYIQRGLEWVANYINQANYNQPEQLASVAYAHLVLAKAGVSAAQGQVENARYLAKQYAKELPSLLSITQLSQSLSLMGEDKLANELIKNLDILHFKRLLQWQDYGSQLRDMAGFAALIAENKITSQLPAYAQAIRWISQMLNFPDSKNYRRYLSTQEQAWLVQLALSLGEDSPLQLSLNGKVIGFEQSETTLNYSFAELQQGKQLSNQGSVPIWINSTIFGEPKKVDAFENGFQISKTLYDQEGNFIDLSQIKQGQRYIMLIQGKATTGLYQRAMVVDLLAAGLEIENANLTASFDVNKLNWLPELSATRYIKALDDRFVAAIDINKGKHQSFSLAYPVRAITRGQFNMPAVYIEDMYQPYFRANTRAQKLQVIE
ncbi:MAG: alpha-2-macroglobulin, partial [Pseudomonadota bacterium]